MTKFFTDYQTEQGPYEEGKVIQCQYNDDLPFILKETPNESQKYFCAKICLVDINGHRTYRKKRYLCRMKRYEIPQDFEYKLTEDTFLEFNGIQIY